MLTNLIETDLIILSKLNDDELYIISQVNNYTNSLFNDNNLWILKINNMNVNNILDNYIDELVELDMLKLHNTSNYYIRQFYYILMNNASSSLNHFIMNISIWAISEGKNSLIKSISEEYRMQFFMSFTSAIKGKMIKTITIETLKIILNDVVFVKILDKLPTKVLVSSKDNLKIFKLLEDKKFLNSKFLSEVLEIAIYEDQLKIIEWIVNNYNLYPTERQVIFYITFIKKIDLISFLYAKNSEGKLPFDFNQYIDNIINSVIFSYTQPILSRKLIYKSILIKIFDWLYNETNIDIIYDSYINILKENNINDDLLKWLIDHKSYTLIKKYHKAYTLIKKIS
jgi:hypothetical protein